MSRFVRLATACDDARMFVVSTAGHVDHGKSTLIRRLTGIDPDRWAEEKARGLTIDLGFAWLTLPSGREVGIVDVPGHERFLHNMLAGVGSVDAVIFVVAANEGWMPQSEEHLQIVDLLGARMGVVALTKTDMVSSESLDAAVQDVRARFRGTSLEELPIVPVSATGGEGIDDLVRAIDDMLARAGEPDDRGRARVFIDRAFSIKGAGTVVTGTLTGGSLRTGEEVVVLPAGHRARIRGIQTHKSSREVAEPVSRVALNLTGLERAQLRRGDAIVRPGSWRATRVLDVELRAVRGLDHPVTRRGSFKVFVGSASTDARLSFHDSEGLRSGERAFARLTLNEPVVAAPFDHVVVRDSGRRTTVAGGRVLDAHPSGRPNAETLRARATAAREDLPGVIVTERGCVERSELSIIAGIDAEPADAVATPTSFLSKDRFDATAAAIVSTLGAFHTREPLAVGMPRDDVRVASGVADARLFGEIVTMMKEEIRVDGPHLSLVALRRDLTPEQAAARDAVLGAAAGFAPPSLAELRARHGEALVRALLERGDLVKLSNDLAYRADELEAAKDAIARAIRAEGPMTAARIKETLGISRKYAIPLLEHLDASGFTHRRGDLRELAV